MNTFFLALILSTSPIVDTQLEFSTDIDSTTERTTIQIINQNGLTTVTTKSSGKIVDTTAFYGTCLKVSLNKRSDEVVCDTVDDRHYYTKLDPLDA